jgi:hypothetical protein
LAGSTRVKKINWYFHFNFYIDLTEIIHLIIFSLYVLFSCILYSFHFFMISFIFDFSFLKLLWVSVQNPEVKFVIFSSFAIF